MKTLKITLSAIIAVAFLASCGGSIKKADLVKYAELQCKINEVQLNSYKNGEDPYETQAYKDAAKALEEYNKKMSEKYKDKKTSEKDAEKMGKILEEEMAKCKVKNEDVTAAMNEYFDKKLEESLKAIESAGTEDTLVESAE